MTDVMRVQRGRLDVCFVYQSDFVRLRNDPKWSQYFTQQLQISQVFLVIDTQMKPFDDVLVRQALNWAIDRDRNAKMQHSPPSYQILPKGMPGYIEGEKFYGHDAAKASELLAEAGYPDGFETTISVPGGSPVVSQIAQALQSDLKEVGIDAKIEQIPAADYFAQLSKPKSVALAVSGWGMDFPDPYAWIKPLFSKSAAVENGTNWSFWWDPKVEEMLTDAQATLDPDERIAKFSEIQRAISDGAPIVPLTQGSGGVLRTPAVGGFYVHPLYQFDPQHYWRQPAEQVK
jgi:peptide/nickel transport system substrate-binding protein/oligopeptide transport system substrate-binding protein